MAGRFDSWDSYLWEPGGDVLRNMYGERDAAVLARMEYAETAKQQLKIERGETKIARTNDAEHLRAIHYELFKNVYGWAGEDRTVGIRKGPTDFYGYGRYRLVPLRCGGEHQLDVLVRFGPGRVYSRGR